MDPYSTHLTLLTSCLTYLKRVGIAIEYGPGRFSTPLLLNNSDILLTVEQGTFSDQFNLEWFNLLKDKFGQRPNWLFIPLVRANFNNIVVPKVDLAFIDGHAYGRTIDLKRHFDANTPIIIAHDTEAELYGWNTVAVPPEYTTIVHKQYVPWTTVWTTDVELVKHLQSLSNDQPEPEPTTN